MEMGASRTSVHAEVGVEKPHEPSAKQYLTVAISGFKHGSYVLPEVFSEVHLRSDLHDYPRT